MNQELVKQMNIENYFTDEETKKPSDIQKQGFLEAKSAFFWLKGWVEGTERIKADLYLGKN